MSWSLFGQHQVAPLSWADSVLQAGGWPRTRANEQSLIAWALNEGGGGSYNPLNSTQGSQYPVLSGNPDSVRNYPNWKTGVAETVATINNGDYPSIVSDLKSGHGIGSNASANLQTWSGSGYSSIASLWKRAAAYLDGKSAPLPGGGIVTTGSVTSTQTTSLVSGVGSALSAGSGLLHGTALWLDRFAALGAPGQGWRIAFGLGGLGAGFGAYKAFTAGGDLDGDGGNLPLSIALVGVASVCAFMALRRWPQEGGRAIKPGAYLVDIATDRIPPAGPSGISPTEVDLTETFLGGMVGLWAASKAARAVSAGSSIIGDILGVLGLSGSGGGQVPPVEVPA